jgi:hypothetical protein
LSLAINKDVFKKVEKHWKHRLEELVRDAQNRYDDNFPDSNLTMLISRKLVDEIAPFAIILQLLAAKNSGELWNAAFLALQSTSEIQTVVSFRIRFYANTGHLKTGPFENWTSCPVFEWLAQTVLLIEKGHKKNYLLYKTV